VKWVSVHTPSTYLGIPVSGGVCGVRGGSEMRLSPKVSMSERGGLQMTACKDVSSRRGRGSHLIHGHGGCGVTVGYLGLGRGCSATTGHVRPTEVGSSKGGGEE
jgi:hypothetical protein